MALILLRGFCTGVHHIILEAQSAGAVATLYTPQNLGSICGCLNYTIAVYLLTWLDVVHSFTSTLYCFLIFECLVTCSQCLKTNYNSRGGTRDP